MRKQETRQVAARSHFVTEISMSLALIPYLSFDLSGPPSRPSSSRPSRSSKCGLWIVCSLLALHSSPAKGIVAMHACCPDYTRTATLDFVWVGRLFLGFIARRRFLPALMYSITWLHLWFARLPHMPMSLLSHAPARTCMFESEVRDEEIENDLCFRHCNCLFMLECM